MSTDVYIFIYTQSFPLHQTLPVKEKKPQMFIS